MIDFAGEAGGGQENFPEEATERFMPWGQLGGAFQAKGTARAKQLIA